jgi:undecaprenyl diphosphate synthase
MLLFFASAKNNPALKDLSEVTFYALSVDNLIKRPDEEINQLKTIMTSVIATVDALILKNKELQNIQIVFVGEYSDYLDKDIVDGMRKIETLTEKHYPLRVNIAICYDWSREINKAVASAAVSGGCLTAKIETLLPVKTQMDLVIRAGNEIRTSGFFPLNTVYSEWSFLPKMWPEVTTKDIMDEIENFAAKERRFGK